MRIWVLVGTALAVCSCGDNGAVVMPDAPVEADAAMYPAFAPPLPTIGTGSGAVLPSVHVVPVFLPDDPLRAQVIDFLGKLAASTEWPHMVSEYGVGALTVGAPIDVTTPAPSTITESEIESYLQQQLAGTSPPWGASSPTTIYVLFYASTTVLSGGMRSCDPSGGFGGFHFFTVGPGTAPIVYAVVAECSVTGLSVVDFTTLVTTHELVEAATDPLTTAYNRTADRDLAWAIAGGSELGDMCEGEDVIPSTPPDIGYTIERTWSNAAAAAGGDPCVPVPDAQPYFGAVPDQPDVVGHGPGGGSFNGVIVAPGTTRTIAVRLFSTAATGQPFHVRAISTSPVVEVALDRDHGANGDTLQLAIRTDAAFAGATPVLIVADLANRAVTWPGLVAVSP